MIDIRDLRKGNRVLNRHDFETYVVATFDDNTAYLNFEGNEGDVLEEDTKDLKPIPFTTEWADKLNLLGQVINGYFVDKNDSKGPEYVLRLYVSDEVEAVEICPIESVHHCQNLFWDICRYEVRIVK